MHELCICNLRVAKETLYSRSGFFLQPHLKNKAKQKINTILCHSILGVQHRLHWTGHSDGRIIGSTPLNRPINPIPSTGDLCQGTLRQPGRRGGEATRRVDATERNGTWWKHRREVEGWFLERYRKTCWTVGTAKKKQEPFQACNLWSRNTLCLWFHHTQEEQRQGQHLPLNTFGCPQEQSKSPFQAKALALPGPSKVAWKLVTLP